MVKTAFVVIGGLVGVGAFIIAIMICIAACRDCGRHHGYNSHHYYRRRSSRRHRQPSYHESSALFSDPKTVTLTPSPPPYGFAPGYTHPGYGENQYQPTAPLYPKVGPVIE